jgi:hypothetical protein
VRESAQLIGDLTDPIRSPGAEHWIMHTLLTRLTSFIRGLVSDDSWRTDETLMSPAERRFVEEGVEGSDADMFVSATFGGGNPQRLLDFPDDGRRH